MTQTMRILFISAFILQASFLSAQSEFSNSTIQIGVVVEDLETSVKFYTDVIGMKRVGGFSIDEDFGGRSGLTAKLPFDVVILKLEDSESATQWKMMSFNKKANHGPQKYIHNDTGIQYVTLYVTSVVAFLERLKANNVKLLGETPVKLGDDRNFILIQDPDGIFIEIIGGD